MIITHKLQPMDLASRGVPQRVDVMQDDKYSRNLQISLYENGSRWQIPRDVVAVIRYKKSDGTGGNYDTLPDGTLAYDISGNVLTVALAPQVCTAPGLVDFAVCLIQAESEITTFAVNIIVQPVPGADIASEEYENLTLRFFFVTQAEYDALPEEEKLAGTYFITDQDNDTDTTLTKPGQAADALAVGERFKKVEEDMIGAPGTGTNAEIFNDKNTNIASGDYTHAEGKSTKAEGNRSHSEGESTRAGGPRSHAEGYQSVATGDSSHAEGYLSVATGDSSHAEGSYTIAQGNFSHAEGHSSLAEKEYSHAEGFYARAKGNYSHAEGNSTIASSDEQHVQGRYNVEDAAGKYAHIVGNGNSDTDRSDAHTLDWDGNAWYAGYVEGKKFILPSTTAGSTKRFAITVDDTGTLSVTEVTE